MVILNVWLDNFYAFKDFRMNLTYPKKIVDSCIQNEHLKDRPNFRYKKVNIIMGANASGKTTLGRILMGIFNFISQKNPVFITGAIKDRTHAASFAIDLVCRSNNLYRITCTVSPKPNGKYDTGDIKLEVRKESIWIKDSYESCARRLEAAPSSPSENYLEELDKVEALAWMFEYPRDTKFVLQISPKDKKFPFVLENILKALDPSIQEVVKSREVEDAYVIRLRDESIILQRGTSFDTDQLSSGTKAGVIIAEVVSALLQGACTFYYCDEQFSYIHSDIEKAILSLMIDSIQPNEQLFFTTHNTDVLDMNLPKHSFTFLRKDSNNTEHPISCVSASSLLKRSSDSLKNAVENDLFSTSPAVDLIYAIAEL
ncbi:MAG: ATP-binding protein [Oscillospiraceae bacterium]|nr:ATP-binding protein [Oscillospiraceae bacterium]